MSFREKMAWVSITVTLAVWGFYFVEVSQQAAAGSATAEGLLELFVRCVVLTIVVEVVLAIAVAASSAKAANSPADERERLIGLRATRIAYAILSVGVVFVALAGPAAAVGGPHVLKDPTQDMVLIMANGVLFALVAAELVRSAAEVIGFRRGV